MKITIPGIPISKARHRVVRRGSYIHTYDPQQCVKISLKNEIQAIVESQYKPIPKNVPIHLNLTFYFPTPPTLNSWQSHHHTAKPDLDNLEKFICDILAGIAFHDDRQIVSLHSKKIYSSEPKTEIEIMEKNTQILQADIEKILQTFSVNDAEEIYKLSKKLHEEISPLCHSCNNTFWPQTAAFLIQKIANKFSKKLAKINKLHNIQALADKEKLNLLQDHPSPPVNFGINKIPC